MTRAMHARRFGALLVISAVLAGCIYVNTTLPLGWVSNTRLDVNDLTLEEREISGQSTAYAVLFGLFLWGDAGLEAALRDARQKAGTEFREVYDIRTDRKAFNILWLYASLTTIVTAKVAK